MYNYTSMSEGLLFYANCAIFQWEQVNFEWDDDRFIQDQQLDFYSALANWNNSPWLYISPH